MIRMRFGFIYSICSELLHFSVKFTSINNFDYPLATLQNVDYNQARLMFFQVPTPERTNARCIEKWSSMQLESSTFDASTVTGVPKGMGVKARKPHGMVLTITEPIGHGEMTLELISPWFVAAKVDFTCDYCPNMTQNPLQQGKGRWLSVNYCHEGRCEVDMGPAGCAVVKADDFCISCADRWPDGFRYPAGCYRGVELWINTELLQDPSFLLLAEAGISLDALADAANPASVFAADDSLDRPMQNIGNALDSMETAMPLAIARCKSELIGLLLAVAEHDLANAKPQSLLSPHQLRIIRSIGESIRKNPSVTYDARVLAKDVGISAATLNAWFTDLYGRTISAYVRHVRMERAAMLLARESSVADTSMEVGYANPSKFAAVFKKEYGLTPSEFRHLHRLGT